jgi:hypothetical protein
MNRQAAGAVILLTLALVAVSACQEEPSATIQTAEPMVRMSPTVGGRGMAMTVRLRGVNTQWEQGDIRLDLGPDIQLGDVVVTGPAFAEVEIVIDLAAALGFRDVSIAFDAGPEDERVTHAFELVGDEGFLVEPGGISIWPDRARLGETLQIEVEGFNTTFQDGSTWADFGEWIFINWVSVADSTHATVSVSVDQRADPGFHDVALFNGPVGYTLMDGFFVDRSSIAIEIDPDHGNQGESLPFVVGGYNTHFDSTGTRATLIDLSTSICVEEGYPDCADTQEPGGEVQVLSPTIVQGDMEISNGAEAGLYDVRAYTIERVDFDEDGLLEPGEFDVLEEVILHEGFEVRAIPTDCNDNPGVGFSFSVTRDIDNDSCTVYESVSASAVFYTPLDPPCGSPPGPPVFPYDIDYVQTLPSTTTDCPSSPTCDAGPFVYLESDLNTITLERYENTYTGEIFYVPPTALTIDDYKFGYVDYDLRAEGSEDPTQIPAFTAPDVLYTLPSDFELLDPIPCQNFTHDPAADFPIEWTPAQTYDVAGLSAAYQTSDTEDPPNTWQVITLPWDDGEHLWAADSFASPFPEGGGFFIFGAGVGEPKWFLDFGEGPVGLENQGRSGMTYRGFMLLASPGEGEEE